MHTDFSGGRPGDMVFYVNYSPNSRFSFSSENNFNHRYVLFPIPIKSFLMSLALSYPSCKHIMLSSVQFSQSVVSDSLRLHGLQHARLPCLSPTPGACSNSCPLSQWCHPTISSSVRESIPKQVDKSRVPEEENGVWGSQGVDRGLGFSRRRKGQTFFL